MFATLERKLAQALNISEEHGHNHKDKLSFLVEWRNFCWGKCEMFLLYNALSFPSRRGSAEWLQCGGRVLSAVFDSRWEVWEMPRNSHSWSTNSSPQENPLPSLFLAFDTHSCRNREATQPWHRGVIPRLRILQNIPFILPSPSWGEQLCRELPPHNAIETSKLHRKSIFGNVATPSVVLQKNNKMNNLDKSGNSPSGPRQFSAWVGRVNVDVNETYY